MGQFEVLVDKNASSNIYINIHKKKYFMFRFSAFSYESDTENEIEVPHGCNKFSRSKVLPEQLEEHYGCKKKSFVFLEIFGINEPDEEFVLNFKRKIQMQLMSATLDKIAQLYVSESWPEKINSELVTNSNLRYQLQFDLDTECI